MSEKMKGGKKKTIVLLPGDGIGPEVIAAAAGVLEDCAEVFGHHFELVEFPIGGLALDWFGCPLPAGTLEACRTADAILLGAVGGPRWDPLPLGQRPESGLLALRKELGLYANVRPIQLRAPLRDASPLRPDRARHIDFEIVRELAGGIYFAPHRTEGKDGDRRASDLETYSRKEIERIVRFAFLRAQKRSKRLASVDKANVLATSALWRATVNELSGEFPGITPEHLYVDNAAMQLVLRPQQFDVIVTSNLFGDILSDAAAALVGSIGLIPSMSCGEGPPLFEPIHGSAPTLVGRDEACPIGAILSASLMLREAFGCEKEAGWIESALDRVLAQGYRTADIAAPGCTVVAGSAFVRQLRENLQASIGEAEPYGWGV